MQSSARKAEPDPKSQAPNDDWWNETVVCIGGGPSLTQADVDYVRNRARVIAINNAYLLAPWADMLYACDLQWWQWHAGALDFSGERWMLLTGQQARNNVRQNILEAAARWNIKTIEGRGGFGLSNDPLLLHTGGNSGYQAINMAYHKGARRVVLLGYDMQYSNNKTHWHGDHPNKQKNHGFDRWMVSFKGIKLQGAIEVINASRQSALRCFPRMPIEEIPWKP